MNPARTRLLESVRSRGLVSDDALAVAEARCGEYRTFGIETDVIDVLSASGALPEAEVEDARRGEDLPSRVAGLDVIRLAGGTPEYPVYLARRSVDGETFLVHACMLARRDAPAEVDAFVKAMENGRRLSRGGWIPVREATGAEGAYAAVMSVPEGVRLDERLANGAHLEPHEAVATAKRVAEALWSVEALGLAAPFPDPSLVLMGRDGGVSLPAIEVLRALRPGTFDPAETARSAANFLARLVGPERLSDPSIRGLLADLSSGRFDGLRPETGRDFTVTAPTGVSLGAFDAGAGLDGRTPVHTDTILLDDDEAPGRAPAYPTRAAAPAAAGAPAGGMSPTVRLSLAAAALVAIVGFVLASRRGDDPAAPSSPNSGGDAVADRTPSGRTDPATPARPAGPTIGDPSVTALETALAYQQAHRDDDPRGVLDRFRALEARYGGSDSAVRAAAAREQFVRELEAEATRRAETAASDVRRFLASEEIGAALAAVDAFPAKLSFTNAAVRVEALRAQVKERAEAVYTSLREVLDAAGDPGRRGAVDAAIDRIKSLGDPELVARARRRVADAEERAGGAVARRKELAPDLERVVGESLVAAGAGDVERARRIVESAGRGPLAQPYKERLAALGDAVARVGFLFDTAATELRARAGKPASLTMREYGTKPATVTIGETTGDRVTYTRGGIAGATRLSAIDPECLVALATGSGREGDGPVALAAATFLARDRPRPPGRRAPRPRRVARRVGPDLRRRGGRGEDRARRGRRARDRRRRRDRRARPRRRPRGVGTGRGRGAVRPDPAPAARRVAPRREALGRRARRIASRARARRRQPRRAPRRRAGERRASRRRGPRRVARVRRGGAEGRSAPRGGRAEAERLGSRVARSGRPEKMRAAKALLDAGKVSEALTALEEVVGADPASLDAWRLLAKAAEKA